MELIFQVRDGVLVPHSGKDQEEFKNYKNYQIIKGKISGIRKPRSYIQLQKYWVCCQTVANNNDDPNWNTKEKVDLQCRMRTHFFKKEVTVILNDRVIFTPRSISFKNLKHIEANNYFNRAFTIMAEFLDVTVDDLKNMSGDEI